MSRRALSVVLAIAGAAGPGCGSSSNEPGRAADGAVEASDAPSDGPAEAGGADGDAGRDAAFEVPDGPISLEEFPVEFAVGYCRRVYDCCAPGDRSVASPGSDEDMCVAGMTENARTNDEVLLQYPGIAYSAATAARCLSLLATAPCAQIFEPTGGVLIACQDVFSGSLPDGAECLQDVQCLSGACFDQTDRCVPRVSCAADQVIDSNGCYPRVGDGALCSVSEQCPGGEACVVGACTQRRAAGAACDVADDCLDACGADNHCRAGFCQGQ